MIIGFAFSVEFKGETVFVDELYIEKEFRGRGIGKKALLFAEEYTKNRGFKALRLEVETANTRAQKIYRQHGFTEHERYIMTKWINKK
ncbi:MAG: GNAT family N-acetyltransferase [Ignavibacteria bacterium]